MIYTAENASGATVYDMDTGQEILHALSIETDAGYVVVMHWPARFNDRGEVDTYRVHFRNITPVFGVGPEPLGFRCYGRQEGA